MTALLANATRQLRGAWPLRYSALATDQSYRVSKMESGDVGCVATSAQRHSAGSVPGMTALVEVTDSHRAPKVRCMSAAFAVADQTLAQHCLHAKSACSPRIHCSNSY
jgi:hypothetical protein